MTATIWVLYLVVRSASGVVIPLPQIYPTYETCNKAGEGYKRLAGQMQRSDTVKYECKQNPGYIPN